MSPHYDEETCRIVKYDGNNPIRVLEWRVSKDTIVAKGSILFVYDDNGLEKRYKCGFFGTLVELFVEENCEVQPGDDLFMYQVCLHPTVMKDLCAECGEDLRQSESTVATTKPSSASVSMIHSVPELRVSVEHAQKLGKADLKRLEQSRKLVLLVDLDQTLIHTTYENVPPDMKDVFHYQLYGSTTPWYHTKLRPHTADFLKTMSDLYELHICTFGARLYAHTIASFLDPTGKIFSHRILSRDECFDPNSKTGNLKALFPCGDSMVCIIDDREDVWNFSPNVVAVKPYVFFKNTGDINCPYKSKAESFPTIENNPEDGSSKSDGGSQKPTDEVPSKTEKKDSSSAEKDANAEAEAAVKPTKPEVAQKEQSEGTADSKVGTKSETKLEDDEDDYLLYLEDILRRLHQEYFRLYDERAKNKEGSEGEENKPPDLKEIVPRLKSQVLNSAKIVFSGVVPTNVPIEKSKLWNIATSLGATVQKDIITAGDECTTHLVAAKFGTAKVNKAIKHRLKVVNPLWLICCAERWEHVEETVFPLNKGDDFSDQPKRKLLPSEQSLGVLKPGPARTAGAAQESKAKISFPVYDPVTGKRINPTANMNSEASEKHTKDGNKQAEPEPHNMIDFSPLSAFSKNDLRMMDKEVDDACSEGDEMSTGNTDSSADEDEGSPKGRKRKFEDSSSDESLTNECPKGWSSRSKGEDEETRESFNEGTKSDSSDEFNDSIGSVDEELAAAVEREFLS